MTILYISILFFAVHAMVFCGYNLSQNRKLKTNIKFGKQDEFKSSKLERNQKLNVSKLEDSLENNSQIILNNSLRQLEFISEFDMYVDTKTLKNVSVEFLIEFKKKKKEAQLVT